MSYVEKKEYLWETPDGAKPIAELSKDELVKAVNELIKELEDKKKKTSAISDLFDVNKVLEEMTKAKRDRPAVPYPYGPYVPSWPNTAPFPHHPNRALEILCGAKGVL